MEQETQTPHKRRVRYKGKYPKKFEEKYKELQPEKYQDTIEHVIRKGNTLLDYGCGKGRVDFFLSAQTRCQSIGVEYDDRIYAKAMENKKAAASGARTEFVLESAENFPVPVEVDRVYFFNPFSLEILRKAMARLLESCYENPREIQLFFYYPSDAYISYLMTVPELEFLDEIDCMDLFPGGDSRERVVIFTIQE